MLHYTRTCVRARCALSRLLRAALARTHTRLCALRLTALYAAPAHSALTLHCARACSAPPFGVSDACAAGSVGIIVSPPHRAFWLTSSGLLLSTWRVVGGPSRGPRGRTDGPTCSLDRISVWTGVPSLPTSISSGSNIILSLRTRCCWEAEDCWFVRSRIQPYSDGYRITNGSVPMVLQCLWDLWAVRICILALVSYLRGYHAIWTLEHGLPGPGGNATLQCHTWLVPPPPRLPPSLPPATTAQFAAYILPPLPNNACRSPSPPPPPRLPCLPTLLPLRPVTYRRLPAAAPLITMPVTPLPGSTTSSPILPLLIYQPTTRFARPLPGAYSFCDGNNSVPAGWFRTNVAGTATWPTYLLGTGDLGPLPLPDYAYNDGLVPDILPSLPVDHSFAAHARCTDAAHLPSLFWFLPAACQQFTGVPDTATPPTALPPG